MTTKTTDSPIDEIHQTRREISDRFGGGEPEPSILRS